MTAKKMLKMFAERNGDPSRQALWEAIGEWCVHQRDEKAMVKVELAAREFGRLRSRACIDNHHGSCTGMRDKTPCECRCHYTRRKSRFRPLRGQSNEAKAARLARGLCPVHGVVLVPERIKMEKGAPVADLLRCSRKDCSIMVEANRKEADA